MVGRLVGAVCVFVLVCFTASGLAQAQQTDPKLWEAIQALKKGQEDIQRQLLELKALIQMRPAGAPAVPEVRNVPVDLGTHLTKGSATAALTMIEFSDYQCPYCGRHTKDVNPQLQKDYVDTGKARYAFFDFPLESIHKSAFKAAEAVHCAGEQGKYWEMHDRLFANQQKLEPWSDHAKALGLDASKFEACMNDGKYADAIRADIAVAQKLGINGTPSFLLALTDPKDPKQVKGLTLIRGAMPFNTFKTEIDKALAPEPPPK